MSMKNGAGLSGHKFKKGKFVAPFNDGVFKDSLQENSWFHNRLPEYLWLALILDHYGRAQGLVKCRDALQALLKAAPDISLPKLSEILALPSDAQKQFYSDLEFILEPDILSPLTVVLTHSHYPEFAHSFSSKTDIKTRLQKLNDVLGINSNHQSNEATDIRFMVVFFLVLAQRMHLLRQQAEKLSVYPTISHDHPRMQMIRAFVRATEIALPDEASDAKKKYLFIFWDGVSRMSDCELYYFEIDNQTPKTSEYMSCIKKQLEYYSDLFQAAHPLDNKMLVLLGIATYSYKRLLEVVEHKLFNTIAGRSVVRVLIEDYIMMKYLLKHEDEHEDIWTEYQYYGIGQYKLVVERFREAAIELPNSHVMYDYMDLIVGEYKNKDFIDMDTSYFDKKKIREKAIDVDERDLFAFYYDYDSAFEHGLWGAIRESSLIKCDNPAHQYHCVPDIDNHQKMQTVWPDCMRTMSRIMDVLRKIYGCPEHLLYEGCTNE